MNSSIHGVRTSGSAGLFFLILAGSRRIPEDGVIPMKRLVHAAMLRLQGDDGQTNAEYAVVLGLITVLIVATISVLSGTEESLFEQAAAVIGGLG